MNDVQPFYASCRRQTMPMTWIHHWMLLVTAATQMADMDTLKEQATQEAQFSEELFA